MSALWNVGHFVCIWMFFKNCFFFFFNAAWSEIREGNTWCCGEQKTKIILYLCHRVIFFFFLIRHCSCRLYSSPLRSHCFTCFAACFTTWFAAALLPLAPFSRRVVGLRKIWCSSQFRYCLHEERKRGRPSRTPPPTSLPPDSLWSAQHTELVSLGTEGFSVFLWLHAVSLRQQQRALHFIIPGRSQWKQP